MKTIDIKSNTAPWRHCTNRHTSTRGFYWGWIEGAPGNLTWSDDPESGFNSADASKVISEHNKWLDESRPVELRLIDARNAEAIELRNVERLENELAGARLKLKVQSDKIAALLAPKNEYPLSQVDCRP